MFKTHEKNIPQLKAALKAYPENGIWFHGCGNMYADKKASDDRQNFTNPNNEESTYRIHFTSVGQVPDTIEALNKMLMASKSQEIIAERANKISTGIKTVKVEDEEPAAKVVELTPAEKKAAEDAEFKRLLEEENAKKGK